MFEKGHSPVVVINCAHWTQPYCFLVMLQGCPDQTKRYITLFWAMGLVMRSVMGSAMELVMLSVMGAVMGSFLGFCHGREVSRIAHNRLN